MVCSGTQHTTGCAISIDVDTTNSNTTYNNADCNPSLPIFPVWLLSMSSHKPIRRDPSNTLGPFLTRVSVCTVCIFDTGLIDIPQTRHFTFHFVGGLKLKDSFPSSLSPSHTILLSSLVNTTGPGFWKQLGYLALSLDIRLSAVISSAVSFLTAPMFFLISNGAQGNQRSLDWYLQALGTRHKPAVKKSLFKMKDLLLILCLLGTSFAVPIKQVFPQQAAATGLGSLSLETMRQLGNLNGLNLLTQFSRFGYGKPFNPIWLHGLLPPHSSFPWLQQREHETQQYEYALPVHPPPLPSQQPQKPGQKNFLQPSPAPDATQHGPPQPPLNPGQNHGLPEDRALGQQPGGPLGRAGRPEMFPMGRLISEGPEQKTEKAPLYPRMFYVPIGANQLNAPGRLGMLSSEEMMGGRGGPMGYGSMFPGMKSGFGEMPQNPAMGGDFTLEHDLPTGASKPPGLEEGGAQGSPVPEADPENAENPAFLPEEIPWARGGILSFPKGRVSKSGRGPAGQIKRPLKGTPPTSEPGMTLGPSDITESFGTDITTPLAILDEGPLDITVEPDTHHTSVQGNKALQPQIIEDVWHFQEP
ncbi:ameloblastin [Trichosurus vulpecula]|uniref:ameloblastin n=1 Tax=Trichosurus vulpecula TaxID=9337 RepID=UPI00186B1BCE|nr:ameloblastin [Trichosurus vulpecula]